MYKSIALVRPSIEVSSVEAVRSYSFSRGFCFEFAVWLMLQKCGIHRSVDDLNNQKIRVMKESDNRRYLGEYGERFSPFYRMNLTQDDISDKFNKTNAFYGDFESAPPENYLLNFVINGDGDRCITHTVLVAPNKSSRLCLQDTAGEVPLSLSGFKAYIGAQCRALNTSNILIFRVDYLSLFLDSSPELIVQ